MKYLRPYQQQAVKECWNALKENDEPILLMACVGSGKSLMLADIALTMQKAGKKVLCIVNNSELVRNNCATFIEQGGKASTYCALLDSKCIRESVVFGSPQSVINGIKKNESISKIKFNLIIIDEAHNIDSANHKSIFLRILRHFKDLYQPMRVLGSTGTNFRYQGTEIVGEKSLFKKQVGNITIEMLIELCFLISPGFEIEESLVMDFSKVSVKKGRFNAKELQKVVDNNSRLTKLICDQIVHVMESQNRFGCFIFATTKQHAYEILSYLPSDESAIILGETKQDERNKIFEMSRMGRIKYIVNIAIVSVGVDIPAFDTVAYLRPTESLVLLIQTLGRALRLSEDTGKTNALVMDFSGNIERHRDWDNPILLDAVKQTMDKDSPLVMICPACQEMNTEHARRCIGKVHDKRCDYYFEFKNCPNCGVKNDISVRYCRECNFEIIDPNDKLSLYKESMKEVKVIEAKYTLSGTQYGFRINCFYKCKDSSGNIGTVYEGFTPINEKSMRVFYGQFVKQHCSDSGKWYPHLHKRNKVEEMLHEAEVPVSLLVYKQDNQAKIKKKYF